MGFSSRQMGFSCVKRNVFTVLPLLILLAITPLVYSSFSHSDKVTKELLNQLCSQPGIDNQFCVNWLTSDPATFTLNLNGLLGLVIQKTNSFGYKNIATLKDLERTTTDPTQKSPYGSCIAYYYSAIKSNKEAVKYAISLVYELASACFINAIDGVSWCEAQLQDHDYVPASVHEFNSMFKTMCNIARGFSDVFT